MTVIRSYLELRQPRIFIEADGSLAEDMIPFITRFEYEDEEAKIDKLTLTVANPGLRFKDDRRFQEGCRFRIRFGYLTDISDVKNTVIAHARPHFGSGMPTIEMVAFNLQKDMNKKSNPTNWGPISTSDIARKIADRYRFDVDIEESNDSRRQHRVQPAGSTDIQYLMNLAKELNFDCYIEGTTLHYHRKRYDTPSGLEFVYFTEGTSTLLKFEPDVDMTSPPATSKAGTDPKSGETEGKGRNGNEARRALDTNNGRDAGLIPNRAGPHAYKGENGLVGPSHETDPRVIAAHGAAAAQRVDMKAIKASAEMVGTPRLRARTMIRISGVDQQYTGNWRVAKSKHVIEPKGVYRTQVALRRDAGAAKSKDQNQHDKDNGDGKTKRLALNTNQGRVAGGFSK